MGKINAEGMFGQFRKHGLNAGDEPGSVLDDGEYGVNVHNGDEAEVVVNETGRKNVQERPEYEEKGLNKRTAAQHVKNLLLLTDVW